MSYTMTECETGDIITADKLNNIEYGISDVSWLTLYLDVSSYGNNADMYYSISGDNGSLEISEAYDLVSNTWGNNKKIVCSTGDNYGYTFYYRGYNNSTHAHVFSGIAKLGKLGNSHLELPAAIMEVNLTSSTISLSVSNILDQDFGYLTYTYSAPHDQVPNSYHNSDTTHWKFSLLAPWLASMGSYFPITPNMLRVSNGTRSFIPTILSYEVTSSTASTLNISVDVRFDSFDPTPISASPPISYPCASNATYVGPATKSDASADSYTKGRFSLSFTWSGTNGIWSPVGYANYEEYEDYRRITT